LSLKAGQYAEAATDFQRGIDWIENKVMARDHIKRPPEYFELSLHLARAWDLLGDHRKANELYQKIAHHPELEDTNLRRLARRAGPYAPERLKKIMMPYSSYVAME